MRRYFSGKKAVLLPHKNEEVKKKGLCQQNDDGPSYVLFIAKTYWHLKSIHIHQQNQITPWIYCTYGRQPQLVACGE